jgi:hypothetical protein
MTNKGFPRLSLDRDEAQQSLFPSPLSPKISQWYSTSSRKIMTQQHLHGLVQPQWRAFKLWKTISGVNELDLLLSDSKGKEPTPGTKRKRKPRGGFDDLVWI